MSVRDKYRATFNEFQRADSIPEKISIFRRAWAWLIIASQKAVSRFGFVLIPLYLIAVSIYGLENCGNLPWYLLMIGVSLLVCSLYPPFYAYGKKKAQEDRQTRINNQLEPLHEGRMEIEEIYKFIPCRMHRVCNFAFSFIMGITPICTFITFKMFYSGDECTAVTFWTSFVIGVIYSIWVVTLLLACCLGCCFITLPEIMGKFNKSEERDVEAGTA